MHVQYSCVQQNSLLLYYQFISLLLSRKNVHRQILNCIKSLKDTPSLYTFLSQSLSHVTLFRRLVPGKGGLIFITKKKESKLRYRHSLFMAMRKLTVLKQLQSESEDISRLDSQQTADNLDMSASEEECPVCRGKIRNPSQPSPCCGKV